MRSVFLFSILALIAFPQGALHAHELKAPQGGFVRKVQQCGWFAIYYCSRDWRDARAAASAEGARVVDSSSPDFPNFRPGWYCAAFGPMGYNDALATRDSLLGRYRDAYAKSSC
jgi:hypothetical protein